jgi:hypothetical protein
MVPMGAYSENENKRSKSLLAEAELDKSILKEALKGNP